jgi:hypothetical protein
VRDTSGGLLERLWTLGERLWTLGERLWTDETPLCGPHIISLITKGAFNWHPTRTVVAQVKTAVMGMQLLCCVPRLPSFPFT